jgi:hypothetical protein
MSDEERLSQEFRQCMSQEPVLETCIMISSDSEDDFVPAKIKTNGSKKKTVLESSLATLFGGLVRGAFLRLNSQKVLSLCCVFILTSLAKNTSEFIFLAF